ncbi:MAG: hypothetical protein RMJ83_06310 [Armatimonadota bacterium]|nr:hypothetical protein [Armatimonadota bacterium]
MKRVLFWLVAGGAILTLAYAQSVIVRGAIGFGFAGDADSGRPNARFSLFVKEIVFGNRTERIGSFSIDVRGENGTTVIYLTRLESLSVNAAEGTASFSGRGWMVQHTRQGVRRVQGTISVNVEDNREPRDREGEPDTLQVEFSSPSASFSYAGVVIRGDIDVFERSYGR